MNDDFGEEYRKQLREQLKPIKQLEKIRLVSNNICYDPVPEPDEIVEQVLIIHADGRVSVSYHPFEAYDPDIREGDEAIVPVGNDGKSDRVYIKSVEVHTAEHAPYPVEKCKHIIQVIKN